MKYGNGTTVENGAIRPDVAFNTSLPPISNETIVGRCDSAATRGVVPGGSTRANHGYVEATDSGVLETTSMAMALARPTFCVGSVTPATFGAQVVLPAIDSPLRRTPPPSGATIGDWQPGD